MAIETLYPAIRPSLNLDFANAKALDPRITFSRASAATYYDGKTVAKAEENLLLYSQEIDNAAWTKLGATVVANAAIAPDGTITADKLIDSTADSAHYVSQAVGSAGIQCVFSIYAKAAELSWIRLTWSGFSNAAVYFDLASGVIGTTTGSLSPIGVIQNVGNGWYRCSMLVTPTSTSGAFITLATGDNVPTYLGTGSQGVLLWGAQLEQRSQVTAYTPTTTQPITKYVPQLMTAAANVPRFDHNPVTGESLGLLVEEQRTNLLTWSEQFDNATWTKVGSTVASAVRTAPSGELTGAKLVEATDTASTHRVGKSFTATSGAAYSFSVYLKKSERSWVMLQFSSATFSDATAKSVYVNLEDGSSSTIPAGTALTVVNAGNGWFRFIFTVTASASAASSIALYIAQSSSILTYNGDGYSGIYIWGAQFEAGAFPTSYIKTEASQVTRAADSASMIGANFSSWYRQDGGTLFLESINEGGVAGGNFGMSDGTNSNRLWVQNDTRTSVTQAYVMKESILQSSLALPGVVVNTSSKVAMAYKANDLAATRSGFASVTDNIASIPIVNKALFNAIGQETAATSSGWIRRATYYPKRLTDAQLQALTA